MFIKFNMQYFIIAINVGIAWVTGWLQNIVKMLKYFEIKNLIVL